MRIRAKTLMAMMLIDSHSYDLMTIHCEHMDCRLSLEYEYLQKNYSN